MGSELFRAEICKARGGARAIATLTFDDGVRATAEALSKLMTEYGLTASLMLVPTRIMGEPPYSSGYLNEEEIKALMAKGVLYPESHSYSHLYIAVPGHPDYKSENCTEENRVREIPGSKNWLCEHFREAPFVAFATPGGSYDARCRELVRKSFYSARVGGLLTGELQSTAPEDSDARGGWYSLHAIWLREGRVPDILEYLDRCVEAGGWFISGCHNIVGTEIGRHNYDITVESLCQVLGKIRSYKERGELWVATMSDATRYLREYESSELSCKLRDGELELAIKTKDITPGGLPLPADIFDLPLTVRVELPDTWVSAECVLAKGVYPCEVLSDKYGKYVYIDMKPNNRIIIREVKNEG